MRLHNMLAAPENEHLLVVPKPKESQCPGSTPPIHAEETQGHIHIRRVAFGRASGWAGRLPFWGNCLRSREFMRSVSGETFDIIHGHNPRACAMASLEFKRRTGLPMVYEAHGIMWDDPNSPQPFGCASSLNWAVRWSIRLALGYYERKVVHAADCVIVQTESARRRLTELYDLKDKPITVIRNGVDVEKFDPNRWEEQRNSLRQRLGWEGRIVCLYAGYLNKVNGIEFLLGALPRLTGDLRRRLKIAFVGRGPLQDEVKQAAKEHGDLIDYPGVARHEEMPGYYVACDVFMIPRLSFLTAEMLLPMKLLEAMAMEKIVLVSNVEAMGEVVTDGENGLVFEKGSTEDFLCKLEMIVQHEGGLGKLGQRARQNVVGEYTWEASRQKLRSIYESLAQ